MDRLSFALFLKNDDNYNNLDAVERVRRWNNGPVHAGMEALGMHELPVFRHLLICYSLDKRPHYM